MYAIVTTGGKQYKVAKGDIISVEKLDAQPGDKVKLDVLIVFKLKKRKRYHRTKGHRQNLTKLVVSSLPTTRSAAAKKADSTEA